MVRSYDDDIIFGSKDTKLCGDFAHPMSKEFEMSMMGELNFILGLQIKQTTKDLHQPIQYTLELIKKFGLESAKDSKIPINTTCKLDKDEDGLY